MTEADWWDAQSKEPTNLLLMAHFADWLQERDDPRWEPMQLLRRYGKVGRRCNGKYVGRYGIHISYSISYSLPLTWIGRGEFSRPETLALWSGLGPFSRAESVRWLDAESVACGVDRPQS